MGRNGRLRAKVVICYPSDMVCQGLDVGPLTGVKGATGVGLDYCETMTNTPPSDLLYPTCAQCKGIGLQAVPDWQFDLEDDLGFDILKALLLAHGGNEVYISKLQIDDPDQVERARAWLFNRFGPSKLLIPLGPLSHSNRVAWTIYTMLRDGASLAQAARAAGVHSRAVSRHKKRLQDFGALPVPQSIITGEPHK